MLKRGIIFAFIFLNLIGIVDAQQISLGTFTQNEEVLIIQICATCTFNNITSITYPNSSRVFSSIIQMTRNSSEYNYTLPGIYTNPTGEYFVNGIGDINGEAQVWVIPFSITKTGTKLNTGNSIIYVLFSAVIFIFFLLCLYFAVFIKYSNEANSKARDPDGENSKVPVFAIAKMKYIKILFIMLSYASFVWFLNALIAISDNFLELTQFFGLVSFLFLTLNYIALPFSIFILILAFFEIIRDVNFNKRMKELAALGINK